MNTVFSSYTHYLYVSNQSFIPSSNHEMSKPGTERPLPSVETEVWGRAGPCTVGLWWGWDRNPAFRPLCTEAPNRGVWVTVYFGAWAVLMFPPTHPFPRAREQQGRKRSWP